MAVNPATEMVIVQDVDKCVRCNGCVISCKRTWKMKASPKASWGNHKVAANQRVVIKSRKKIDMGEFVRYSCWHCDQPPCAANCPVPGAMGQDQVHGGVWIDHTKCDPSRCAQQCLRYCGRGGYPRIGVGSDLYATSKAYKCTLCFGRAGIGGDLPTKDPRANPAAPNNVYNHQPSCVFTCPAKAMMWEKKTDFFSTIRPQYLNYQGGGHVYWVSNKYPLLAPKADPFVEDHVMPMVSGLLTSPLARAAVVPTIIAGGLIALSARRAENEGATLTMEGEV